MKIFTVYTKKHSDDLVRASDAEINELVANGVINPDDREVYKYAELSDDKKMESAVLVPESFSWWGFLFPINLVWSVYRRVWLLLALVILCEAATYFLSHYGVVPKTYVTFMRLPVIFAFGLFANDLWRRSLKRRGYSIETVVSGKTAEEAQLRYYQHQKNLHA